MENCPASGKCNVCLPVLALQYWRLSPGLYPGTLLLSSGPSSGLCCFNWWQLHLAFETKHASMILMTTKGLIMQLIRLKGSATQNMVLFLFCYLLFTCAVYFLIGISKYQRPSKKPIGFVFWWFLPLLIWNVLLCIECLWGSFMYLHFDWECMIFFFYYEIHQICSKAIITGKEI